MIKKILAITITAVLLTANLTGCTSKNEESSEAQTTMESSKVEETKETEETKKENKALGEDEIQRGKGVNGIFKNPDYSYEGIVNGPVGIYPSPRQRTSYSVPQWVEITNEWRDNMKAEVDKIEKPLKADATDEDIDYFLNQLLYIVGSDYSAIEGIDRFGYVIFKNDMEDPFTKQSIVENTQVNVEIVLDASGSMAKKIEGQTMMDIAKNSIAEVLKQLPANAKVGLRVFGHKGDNTDAGKTESCGANELIYPIDTLNAEGIAAALAPIQPTGWTSIASSIKNGVQDLSAFQGENDVNILYIITDGIETCGGDPVAAAKELKDGGTNIVFGIIGFNVDAAQDALLKEIAAAGEGYYSNASDAGGLTAELYRIGEAANSVYNWEPLTQIVCLNLKTSHNNGLLHNKMSISGENINENAALSEAARYAYNNKMISDENGVYDKLKKKIQERRDIINKILEEEYQKRETESKDYLAYLETRKGEDVAIVRTTSRVNPFSDYYIGPGGIGGDIEDQQKEGEELNSEREESMKNK